ncbi:hypothetical protein OS493_038899 [Desmophyllum pertusum]|uniref:Uncharacterized protein n=1 Tax=Desmophyllum pertusum TaxID=174260 RepID=A0A9X0D010_9CNID|nr:hypothetical protein OS493_038899 [Desmophyllum pertusum]
MSSKHAPIHAYHRNHQQLSAGTSQFLQRQRHLTQKSSFSKLTKFCISVKKENSSMRCSTKMRENQFSSVRSRSSQPYLSDQFMKDNCIQESETLLLHCAIYLVAISSSRSDKDSTEICQMPLPCGSTIPTAPLALLA